LSGSGGAVECGLDPAAETVDPDARGFACGGRLYCEEMSERPAAASAAVALPDRVTVLTCIGCGAMGREERCDGDCSERKLLLVTAADYHELLGAAHGALVRAARMVPAVRRFAEADAQTQDPLDALLRFRESARRALRGDGRGQDDTDWASPDTVTGWWCARCGNVDMVQPCIGVCIWRPADWVNLALYEHQLRLAEPGLRAARSLSGFLARMAAVTPRAGQGRRNWEALQAQARAALRDLAPDSPAPDSPPAGAPRPDPDSAVGVYPWPR
jgi:hypothetical protein